MNSKWNIIVFSTFQMNSLLYYTLRVQGFYFLFFIIHIQYRNKTNYFNIVNTKQQIFCHCLLNRYYEFNFKISH